MSLGDSINAAVAEWIRDYNERVAVAMDDALESGQIRSVSCVMDGVEIARVVIVPSGGECKLYTLSEEMLRMGRAESWTIPLPQGDLFQDGYAFPSWGPR